MHIHNHRAEQLTSLNTAYLLAMALNFGFVLVEAAIGLIYNSLGLLSGAGHKLFDVFWLFIAIVAFKLTTSKATKKYTYGLRKTSILIALVNAVILLAAVCLVIYESILKFSNPTPVSGEAISWTAGIGILVSGISALLLANYRKKDINTRGVFLHMATDALVSFGMVISGIIISCTGWDIIDPIISICIAGVILYNSIKLLISSFKMSIDAVPEDINYDDIEQTIKSQNGVSDLSDLHIWPVSITETALTVRINLVDEANAKETVSQVRQALSDKGIKLTTIEVR